MIIRIIRQIQLKDKTSTAVEVYKDYISEVIPHKGDMIKEFAFDDPGKLEVIEVEIDYKDNCCYVRLPIYEIDYDDVDYVRRFVEYYQKTCGWKSKNR